MSQIDFQSNSFVFLSSLDFSLSCDKKRVYRFYFLRFVLIKLLLCWKNQSFNSSEKFQIELSLVDKIEFISRPFSETWGNAKEELENLRN